MQFQQDFSELNFNRRIPLIPPRMAFVILSLVIFSILWWAVPQNLLYWLLLPVIGIFAWITSYGWRQALVNFIHLLRNLEKFFDEV